MLIMIFEAVPQGLRGELSRWMLELKAGVFVGNSNAMVRDRLWELCSNKLKEGGAWQIFNKDNEQGFEIRAMGETKKAILDFEGILLIKTKN